MPETTNQRLSIDQVAEILGETPHQIRVKCKYGMYDPPIARIQNRPGAKINRYVFYKPMVEAYITGKK